MIIELDDGTIYRKALYLMVKTMVSCNFSLKPIQRHDDLSPIDHQDWTKVPYTSGAALLPALDQVVRELQMSGTKDVKVGQLGVTRPGKHTKNCGFSSWIFP